MTVEPRASTALIVVMGVSGSGKTTVGQRLAQRLGLSFEDADDLHPAANVAKMAAGHPLTDDDRRPWLASVGAELASAEHGLVMACSALKRRYRQVILDAAPAVRFVELEGSRALLESRMTHRRGHFMPASLLDSQLAALESLAADEPGVIVRLDGGGDPDELASTAIAALGLAD